MTLDYFYGQAGELFSFFRIPKALFQEQQFQDLSTDAKTLYGILLDRMSLSVKNEWFDKQGRVFIIFTIEDVKRALCCADNKATKLLRELENFGLIERKRRGLGKPSLVYVKNFSSDLSNERVQNRENHESGSPKNACQDSPKSRCNKNKKSKTERNNTNPKLYPMSRTISKMWVRSFGRLSLLLSPKIIQKHIGWALKYGQSHFLSSPIPGQIQKLTTDYESFLLIWASSSFGSFAFCGTGGGFEILTGYSPVM